MSYQVLARKWRPKDFSELVGQEQTAQALINALESQRLHHAYLFTGTRGVGKTTIARILSKSLNCEKGITSTPCGECASCVEISQGNFVDLLEIDAASKTKVEDTRELLDNVQYRPTRGRYKVYLIDEVHMLSGHSFNALLKTLEEPPPHVIFLLATTDPQKMPVTVLSRCLQFHLRRMEEAEIISHLSKILGAEQIEFEADSLQPIAKGADGSMRDALSLLDQAIAYCGNKIQTQTVLDMLGSIDRDYAFQLLDAITADNAQLLMQTIDNIAQFSPDFDELLADWLGLLHSIAVCQATTISSDDRIKLLAEKISPADLQLFYQLSLQARKDIALAPHPRQGFEMAMLRILSFKPQSKPPANRRQAPHSEQESRTTEKKTLANTPETKSEINGDSTAPPEVVQNTQVPGPSVQAVSSSGRGATAHAGIAQSDPPIVIEALNQNVQAEPPSTEQKRAQLKVVIDNNKKDSSAENAKTQTRSETKPPAPSNPENVPGEHRAQIPGLEREDATKAIEQPQTSPATDLENKPQQPQITKVTLDEFKPADWFQVIQGMRLDGQGLQVLLNATASFEADELKITYQTIMEPLLTNAARQLILDDLRDYFHSPKLKVSLKTGDTAGETPRQMINRKYEEAVNQAHDKMLANPQIKFLMDSLGATMDRESVLIDMARNFVRGKV